MPLIFPENTPLYTQLKYLSHAGVTNAELSRENFLHFLIQDAYWLGVADCITPIKLYWLESQDWASSLFVKSTSQMLDGSMVLFRNAEIYYEFRNDLSKKFDLSHDAGLSTYMYEIYFGESSQEYFLSKTERNYLLGSNNNLEKLHQNLGFNNGLYLIYKYKVATELSLDISTTSGRRMYAAYLFVNSKIWSDRLTLSLFDDFIKHNPSDLVSCISEFFAHISLNDKCVWSYGDVLDYMVNSYGELYLHKPTLNKLFSALGLYSNVDDMASEKKSNDNAALKFESFLHSADGRLYEDKIYMDSFQLDTYDCCAFGMDEYFECKGVHESNRNVYAKAILTKHIDTIPPELLQNFVRNCMTILPIEIYAATEAFNIVDSSTELFSDDGSVSVVGFSRSEIGTGEDTRNTVNAIKHAKYGQKLGVFNLLPEGSTYKHSENSVMEYESLCLAPIQIYTMPPTIYMSCYLNNPLIHAATGYKIGYLAWEFSEWKKEFDIIYDFFDEIWVISDFLTPAFSGHDIPVHYIPPVVSLSSENYQENNILERLNLPEDKFLLLCIFDIKSSIIRKNPEAVIKGFLAAFPDDDSVSLVLKFSYDENDYERNKSFFELIAKDKRIYLISELLKKSDVESLIYHCDALVSLHRSEGFGRVMAEAMLLKTPVICTGYSGNMDFCNEDTALLVDYELTTVNAGEYPFSEDLLWAVVKHEAVVENMRKVRTDLKGCHLMVERAYNKVSSNHSLESAGLKLVERLNNIKH